MKKYIIASSKKWFQQAEKSPDFLKYDFVFIENKNDLSLSKIRDINPRFIFFPHWNWIVPKEIYESYECVVFHTAPLPFGRGGSPIQNLIIRNFKSAPVCALKMNEILDGGPIYNTFEISLSGSCDDIFNRIAHAVQQLMLEIIKNEPTPLEQLGEPVYFKRRTSSENELPQAGSLLDIYNHIRMLDSFEYPKAFIHYGNFNLEFTNASHSENSIEATVKIKLR